jgi:hypothetical protein
LQFCDKYKTILSLVITRTINKSPNVESKKKAEQLTKKEQEDNKVNKKVEKVITNLKKELKNIASDEVIKKFKSFLGEQTKINKDKLKKRTN